VSDFEQIKARTREAWNKGDYEPIGRLLLPVARSLVDACAISAGQEVLDVGAGNGNLALLAAEEGADVTATDLAPVQVERGRARLAAEGVDVEWQVADAEALPFDDDSFECVASVFGAIFAPRPEVVARELFRVVKPGNTVGITAWGDYGVQAEIFKATFKYAPPPPDDVPPPMLWGDEEVVRERFGPYAGTIESERRTVRFEFPSAEAAFDTFSNNGPGKTILEKLPEEMIATWRAELVEIVTRNNIADGDGVAYDAEYLEVVARRRG
jgi:2-polyprenyl-6-hydroxyphenyl methylase/3-demethylubiquinone-9 3-methyltransferase